MNEKDLEQIEKLLSRKLEEQSAALDKKLDVLSDSFDRKLDEQSAAFDKKLNVLSVSFDRKLEAQSEAFDKKLDVLSGSFDRKLGEQTAAFDEKLGVLAQSVDRKVDAVAEMLSTDFSDKLKQTEGSLHATILVLETKVDLVIENQQAMLERMDRMEIEQKELNRSLDRRISNVAANLAAHKSDPQAHERGYSIKEDEELFDQV